jgi:hypothetical protein
MNCQFQNIYWWIRIDFNADPASAFFVNADSDPDPGF